VWQSFFKDLTQWWDNRFDKRNPCAPDFRHKITRKGLWVSGRTAPNWVREVMVKIEGCQSACEVMQVVETLEALSMNLLVVPW
jgi:hypothetical protein